MNGLTFDQPEGATPLDPEEAHDLLPSHIATMAELNEWEQTNILRADNWLFSRKRSNVLTDHFVRELHKRMFDKTWRWAGQYRLTGKNIGVPAHQIAMRVRETCEDVALWVAEGVVGLDEAAVGLHHRMVSVHPFSNGNGRHTRLLADALLFQHDRPRFTWGNANLQRQGDARRTYLAALRSADDGNLRDLLDFARS